MDTAKTKTIELKGGNSARIKWVLTAPSRWCGSTLGSGEWWPTLERAVAEAKESIADHEKRGAHAAVKQ